MRKIQFANGEYYHIFNRGVDKRKIFLEERDYQRFLFSLNLLNDDEDGLLLKWRDYMKCKEKSSKPFLKLGFRNRKFLVDIIVYCLNPNHYHLLVKQRIEKGVERFMHKLGTSYTKYFNEKYKRSGVLFQGKFKAVHIKNNAKLLYLSAYINQNSQIHGIAKSDKYPWSSYSQYSANKKFCLCRTHVIVSQFRNAKEYKEFCKENLKEMIERKQDEKLLMEE
ncbi:MAG: transposase [Parcubacteria group bacterium]|jgi:REP element-mobilizing transposase RayT